MKTFSFATLFMLMSIAASSQSKFSLPDYTTGKYEKTTVYHYFGPINNTGKGSASVSGSVNSKFVSGMKFYMVVDSIDPGMAPNYSAYKDSAGTSVPMLKGDKLPFPVSFHVYSGKIGFDVVIEGTPSISGEIYFCELTNTFTLSDDFGLFVSQISQKTCVVDVIKGITDIGKQAMDVRIYPNPTADQLTITGNFNQQQLTYRIFDKIGREVQNGLLTSQTTEVNIHQLIPGDYMIQIGSELRQTFKIIKQ